MQATALGRAMFRAGALEPFRSYPESAARLASIDGDESLDEFLSARLGPELARTLGSALVHGIYAADSRVLSVRTVFPSLWEMARDGRGSIVRGMLSRALRRAPKEVSDDYDLGDVPRLVQDASVYSFKEGMITLVSVLQRALRQRSNVETVRDDGVARIERNTIKGDMQVSDSLHICWEAWL
jgi:protoporphyrinogen/coproporphyrinogen III oxidase